MNDFRGSTVLRGAPSNRSSDQRDRRPALGLRPGLIAGCLLLLAGNCCPAAAYSSPVDLAFSADGRSLAVADPTANCVWILPTLEPGPPVPTRLEVPGSPVDVAWGSDDCDVYVSLARSNSVVLLDARSGSIRHRWSLPASPAQLALAPRTDRLLVALPALNRVALLDPDRDDGIRYLPAKREPRWLALTPDETTAVVVNFLPGESLQDPRIAAVVDLLDVATGRNLAEIRLPTGSTLARQVVLSADGRWGYVVHVLARFVVPVSQLDRAWVASNALTIIDLENRCRLATVLLDQLNSGAAEPWGAALSPDGQTLWLTLAGVHEIARIDVRRLQGLIAGELPPPAGSPARPSAWELIRRQSVSTDMLANDLDALTQAGVIQRWPIPSGGPRGIAFTPEGPTLAVASYFTGEVLLVDAGSGRVRRTVGLGIQPPADPVRLGEAVFHDATRSLQHWLSCSTCHPDGRVDGLNWDLMNDGIANPKNTKSLVWAHRTPPVMSLAVRPTMEAAALAGFRYTQNFEPDPAELDGVRAYIRSLKPEADPAPDPSGPAPSGEVLRGKTLFEDPQVGCAVCHPAPLFTDRQTHKVGTGKGDEVEEPFDTPTLVEIRRTAPYLHHGLAASLADVLSRHNPDDRHGITSHLSPEERDALVAYLKSL